MPYKFFLSYSRRDAKDSPYLHDFYKQLANEVGQAAGLPAAVAESEIGFFDQEGIEPGDTWPDKLAEALGDSAALVCLYSNSFFNSEACGKEFEAFRLRVRAHTPPGAPAPSLIIPVLWDLPDRLPERLPEAVTNLQYTHISFGPDYAADGVAFCMKQENKPAVARIASRLANLIVSAATANPLPSSRVLSYGEVRNAFLPPPPAPPETPAPAGGLPPDSPPPEFKGPDVAWYVYVAGRQSDYAPVRRFVGCYGTAGGYQWQPHLPPRDVAIGAIVPQVGAGKGRLTPIVLPLSQRLVEHLKDAEDANTVAVLIVDPWSVKVQSLDNLLLQYDERRLANCEIIIIWNDADEETRGKRAELADLLWQRLWRSLGTPEQLTHVSAGSEAEFREKLNAAVERAKERLDARSKPARPVPHNRGESMPTISGASGTI